MSPNERASKIEDLRKEGADWADLARQCRLEHKSHMAKEAAAEAERCWAEAEELSKG